MVDHARTDEIVGSVVVTIPPLAEVPVARLSEPVDPARVTRAVCGPRQGVGLQFTLPWPEGVVDSWITVSGPDGTQIVQGVASRGGTDRELWFWSELRWADPAWSSIALPDGVDPDAVRVEVRWIENSVNAAAKASEEAAK